MISDNAEIKILGIVADQSLISQREIARRVEISLAMVNTIIKKCIKNGFIKTENINQRAVKYILTPKGLNKYTENKLDYIKQAYSQIAELKTNIEKIVLENNIKKVILFGENDEVYEIIKTTLDEHNVQHKITEKVEDKKEIYFLWDNEKENELVDVEFINVLEFK